MASPWPLTSIPSSLTLLVALMLATLAPSTLAQSDEERTRRQLEQLEQDIKRINFEIAEASTRRSTIQRKLRDAEVEMGEVKKAITATTADISTGEAELQALQAQQTALEAARDAQQARIAVELRAAWRTGDQAQLKVLLNQTDPNEIARAMAYYRYVFDAREDLLQEYRNTLTDIEQVALQIATTLEGLAAQRETLEDQRKALVEAQAARELAILDLSEDIDSKAKQLKKLQEDRQELESLLQAIEEAVVNMEVPDDFQPFEKARGAMPWPIQGKASNRFGRPRNEGKMRWQGLMIPSKEGTSVQAIHHGRVVYADWLRGSGLLIIIDHGEGYMSLYAHNSSLLRDVGEWVNAGTPIATVGSSGGRDRAELYFEIRHQGKPTDPAQWCTD
ncbi:MAG: peptidoglycan DD-metalloendopeptidase family protein [Gammaproteobacteria bacterium]|nr:peptidoglycan DD-metalloendopeptidase family protein [Gammaproteobacteria bacterium]